MDEKDHYFVFMQGDFQKVHLWKMIRYCHKQEPEPMIWSARLGTGIVGLTSCNSGREGPEGYNEVILGVGDEGLVKLGELGFIPCPTCHPEEVFGFWDGLEGVVKQKYDINSLDEFLNRKRLPYDARRLHWEELIPMIGKAPNRLYLRRNLTQHDLSELKNRFESLDVKLPPVGYFDVTAKEKFREYTLH